jgi:hypothetical protein
MTKKGFTYKGDKKPYGKSGHFVEPRRHALQAKGIKTGHYGDVHPFDYVGKPVPKEEIKPELTEEEQFKKELAEGLGADADSIEVEDEDGHYIVKDGNQEWIVFNSEDDAERYAVDKVKEDLEDSPEMFTQSWLEGFITITDTDRRMIAQEESDDQVDNMDADEITNEKGLTDDIERMEAEFEKPGNILDSEQQEEAIAQLVENAREELREEKYDEIYEALKDPIEYFVEERGIYSREDLLKQSFISIDTDEASQDAVDTDGVAHFLASYDGDEVSLPNGKVAYRTN